MLAGAPQWAQATRLRNKPVAVWTGSTNISAGGIFGHSNVGHEVWDADIAERYLAFWERLAAPDVKRGPLVEANLEVEPTPKSVALTDDLVMSFSSSVTVPLMPPMEP